MSRVHDKYLNTGPLRANLAGVGATRRRCVYRQPVRPKSAIGTILRKLLLLTSGALALAILALLGYKLWVDVKTDGLIYKPDDPAIPRLHVAIVFGAGLNADGSPSPILYDRVATAVDLYNNSKVDKLLMSGDNSTIDHNEVEAMRRAAVKLGIPDEDIVLDYAGFSTWDSCYRARDVFSLSDATLVTQRFHLPRALYTCNKLGVKSVGVAADRQSYSTLENDLREFPALANTAFRFLTDEKPRFLGPKIDVDQPQDR